MVKVLTIANRLTKTAPSPGQYGHSSKSICMERINERMFARRGKQTLVEKVIHSLAENCAFYPRQRSEKALG